MSSWINFIHRDKSTYPRENVLCLIEEYDGELDVARWCIIAKGFRLTWDDDLYTHSVRQYLVVPNPRIFKMKLLNVQTEKKL